MPVSDMPKAVTFYCDNLQFKVIVQQTGFALLERDHITIQLWLSGDQTWQQRTDGIAIVSGAESFLAGTASCRIAVQGVDELYADCRAADIVHPNGHLERKDYGATEFAILDPFWIRTATPFHSTSSTKYFIFHLSPECSTCSMPLRS